MTLKEIKALPECPVCGFTGKDDPGNLIWWRSSALPRLAPGGTECVACHTWLNEMEDDLRETAQETYEYIRSQYGRFSLTKLRLEAKWGFGK